MYTEFSKGFSNVRDNHPVVQYFKNEYRGDWEYEFLHFMEEKKTNKKSLLSRLFPNHQNKLNKNPTESLAY